MRSYTMLICSTNNKPMLSRTIDELGGYSRVIVLWNVGDSCFVKEGSTLKATQKGIVLRNLVRNMDVILKGKVVKELAHCTDLSSGL